MQQACTLAIPLRHVLLAHWMLLLPQRAPDPLEVRHQHVGTCFQSTAFEVGNELPLSVSQVLLLVVYESHEVGKALTKAFAALPMPSLAKNCKMQYCMHPRS